MATTDIPKSHPKRILALFDVDGTLTIPRGDITPEMLTFMKELSHVVDIGIVGGT
jgi:phosphomannomutase